MEKVGVVKIGVEEARAHFGCEQNGSGEIAHGCWPSEKVMEELAALPSAMLLMGLNKKKFRLVLDYDPEFPWAIIRFLPCEAKGLSTETGSR